MERKTLEMGKRNESYACINIFRLGSWKRNMGGLCIYSEADHFSFLFPGVGVLSDGLLRKIYLLNRDFSQHSDHTKITRSCMIMVQILPAPTSMVRLMITRLVLILESSTAFDPIQSEIYWASEKEYR